MAVPMEVKPMQIVVTETTGLIGGPSDIQVGSSFVYLYDFYFHKLYDFYFHKVIFCEILF